MSFVRCKRCLIPISRPSTHFEDGICSACRNFERRREIDWDEREKEFLRIIESLPINNSGYQVIVASSGGKDSTMLVVKMLELGVKPLVVTATTCQITEIGRKNIDNLARLAKTVEYTPDPAVRAKLNKFGLQMVGDISLPEHMAIFSTPFRAAVEYGIPVIIYGESPQFEYGGPPDSEKARTMTRRWTSEHGGFLGMRPRDFIGMDGITADDMSEYMMPADDKLKNITAYFLGQYYPWDSHENAKVAEKHGFICKKPFQGNRWKHENQDNAQTGIHDYFKFLKFGFGRYCDQVSVDIRRGRISRDAAYFELLKFDGLFPYRYMGVWFEDVLSHIGVTKKEFDRICDRFTNHQIFTRGERLPRETNAGC